MVRALRLLKSNLQGSVISYSDTLIENADVANNIGYPLFTHHHVKDGGKIVIGETLIGDERDRVSHGR